MSSAAVACLLVLSLSVVTGYNNKGHLNNGLPMFPMIPAQQNVFPGQLPVYQNEVPFLQAPPMWPDMQMPQIPFFHPIDCDIPIHQHNMDFLSGPFMGQNQLAVRPFEGQGQWKQTPFANLGQGQWKQMPFTNQGPFKQMPFMNQAKGQWEQMPFMNKDLGGQLQQTPFKRQVQLKQTPFVNQGQAQWKQGSMMNTNKNVNMIGQWEGIPVNNRMLSQPAISGLTQTGQNFKPPKDIPRTIPDGFEAPIQSRRLR